MALDLLSQAISLHQAGRLTEAESLYQAILRQSPSHADALNLLGVIAHQRADYRSAIDLIGRAIALRGNQPAYYCNLSAAYCGIGRFEDAAASAETALSIDPNLIDAHLNLGLAQKGAKRWSQARQIFSLATERWPNDSRGWKSLGDCFCEEGQIENAIESYENAIALNKDDGNLHLLLGTVLATNDEPFAAEPYLRRAVELMPNSVTALVHFGACLTQAGKGSEALAVYESALQLHPGNAKARIGMAQAYSATGDFTAAEQLFKQVLSVDSANAGALYGLADVYRSIDHPEEAIKLSEQAIQIDDKWPPYGVLADALSETGATDRAEQVLREAICRFPNQADAWVTLGAATAAKGDRGESLAAYARALLLRRHHPLALARIALMEGNRFSDDMQATAHAAIDRPAPVDQLASLHFGLAHVEDSRGNYTRAAELLRRANELDRTHREIRGTTYDPEASREYSRRVIATFSAQLLARAGNWGNPSEQPVFVVGMPRSGTTLIEQILASHPSVTGIGERKLAFLGLQRLPDVMKNDADPLDCVAEATESQIRGCADWHLEQMKTLGRNADRIVDKMPENFLFLGWLGILFPRARFIHSRRDLRDTALSCWMTNFTNVLWSNDLRHIASRIREYRLLMDHWQTALGGRILTVDYEKLVADQEIESKRLIEWLGLQWDPACLDFHHTQRVVRTASVLQVRQPIYSRSIGRWRHYRDELRPPLEQLGLEWT